MLIPETYIKTGAYGIGCCRGLYSRRMIGARSLLPLLLEEKLINVKPTAIVFLKEML